MQCPLPFSFIFFRSKEMSNYVGLLGTKIYNKVLNFVDGYIEFRNQYRSMYELNKLTDTELRDIGITRNDIHNMVKGK